ncbi:uncharacterized protein [Aristolochia californica]|uniref:uncharacterized protein n=1 Tax=Aristolochia californica TaxID=171875 RepID=UPI0035E01DDC
MEQRKAKGLCFNCDDQYVQEEEIEETDQEDLEISLHAMTGLRSSNTMQVQAQLHHLQLFALVDSGNTHNFISQLASEQLGLVIQQQIGLSVSVANGAKIASVGISPATHIDIEGHSFIVDFLVIPLSGFDLVLGVKLLQLLDLFYGIFRL